MRALFAFVTVFLASPVYAFATEWHWETFGASSYSGQVNLRDDLGAQVGFQRYNSGSTPQLFGSASVQSPVAVIAASSDISISIVTSGVQRAKKICTAPKVWKPYISLVTACNPGTSSNIAGLHMWAQNDSATRYTPRLSVNVPGYGWRAVTNSLCGNLQVIEMCE